MNFQEFVTNLASIPVFKIEHLYAVADNPQQAQRKITEWIQAGKVIQLRPGVYSLAPSYQLEYPHSYVVANQMVQASYVSLQTALSNYDLIPEYVPVVVSITTCRPEKWHNLYGHFNYEQIESAIFFGFEYRQVTQTQWAFVATPEKALLDLIYLTPDSDKEQYIRTLRLQNLDQLNIRLLTAFVERINTLKLKRALPHIIQVIKEELTDYKPL